MKKKKKTRTEFYYPALTVAAWSLATGVRTAKIELARRNAATRGEEFSRGPVRSRGLVSARQRQPPSACTCLTNTDRMDRNLKKGPA